jgi:membrane protein involved in colicin uptake
MRQILMLAALNFLVGCAATNLKPDSCFDMESCVELVTNKLSSNFPADRKFKGQEIKIEFFLNDNAEVIQYKITNESGIPELDIAAIKAVKASSPFNELKVLPADVFNKFKHVKLTVAPTFEGL